MSAKVRTETITKDVKFRCRPADLFAAFTDARMMQAYTQAPATCDANVGGKFSLFGGSLNGEFQEIVPDAKIVQSWRFVDWHDGVTSTVTFEFSSTQYGVTSLKVRQTGVPEEDKFGHRGIVPKVADGWNSKFFTPISKVLGFAFYTEDDDD